MKINQRKLLRTLWCFPCSNYLQIFICKTKFNLNINVLFLFDCLLPYWIWLESWLLSFSTHYEKLFQFYFEEFPSAAVKVSVNKLKTKGISKLIFFSSLISLRSVEVREFALNLSPFRAVLDNDSLLLIWSGWKRRLTYESLIVI